MSWWEVVLNELSIGDIFYTPGRGIQGKGKKEFSIISIDNESIYILSGDSEIKIEKSCFDVVENAFKIKPTLWLRIASSHSREPFDNSVDKIVREETSSSLARGNYISSILEKLKLVEYSMDKNQKGIKLHSNDATTRNFKQPRINLYGTISIIISFVAIAISILSLITSIKSNEIAEDALIKTERPYLNVDILEFEEDKSFYKAAVTSYGVLLTIQYKLTNKGKSIASNITLPDNILFSGNIDPNLDKKVTSYKKPDSISLGPEETQVMEVSTGLTCKNPSKLYEDLMTDNYTTSLKMIWNYKDMLSANFYKTTLNVNIKRSQVDVIQKIME